MNNYLRGRLSFFEGLPRLVLLQLLVLKTHKKIYRIRETYKQKHHPSKCVFKCHEAEHKFNTEEWRILHNITANHAICHRNLNLSTETEFSTVLGTTWLGNF